ncbi:DinB family protein [Jiulongibacter sediminis]|uniref:DinB family protein n=1 Tax=Jiulongibacter sediminis TaxID=1605367 RepID=UPI0006DCC673|nr:DinB family protein [Jiulongibacter sediminis]
MTRQQLIQDIDQSYNNVIEKISSVSEEEFYQKKNGKWSIAENLAHLTLSAKLMNRALNAPKIGLLLRFGLHLKSFRDINWMNKTYAAATIPSTTSFEPRMQLESSKSFELKEFKEKHLALISSVNKWGNPSLDFLQLPHIVFGKLSIREYLMFIAFHIRHHEKAIDRIIAPTQSHA